MTAAPSPGLPSLRRLMLWRVMLPLALTWLLGSAVAVSLAVVYTRKAFDRSLLDDAHAIAAHVAQRDGQLAFGLSAGEVEAVLFDRDEKVFFSILRGDGSLLSGQGGLRGAAPDAADGWSFEDVHYRGADLRSVTLWRQAPQPHAVVVATTTRSRATLVGQLLGASVAPQALLLVLLGLWLRRSIGGELRPLMRLGQALSQRDTRDLTPLAVAPQSRDIAQLMDACNSLLARIDASVRAQREFAGDVAHELRTPLAGIRSLAEYGLAQKDPQAWADQLRHIVVSEQRASHLVDQLLALALADKSGQNLQLQPLALDAVLRALLLRLLPRADAAGVDLGAEGLDAAVPVLGSAALIEGAVGNLVDNALRYGRPADPAKTQRITVAAVATADAIELSVTDNGPGLDASQRQRLLSRWEQGSADAAQAGASGSGLGLAIVARYAALLGARLALRDAPHGPGLRVSLWLQRAPGTAQP